MDVHKLCRRGSHQLPDPCGFLENAQHIGMLNLFFFFFADKLWSGSQTILLFRSLFQASNEEGASKVFELLQGKAFRSIGWNTLFDCLSIYEQKFKQSLQSTGALLPEFQEGDAKALVAYLNVLQKVLNHSRLLISKSTNSFLLITPLQK